MSTLLFVDIALDNGPFDTSPTWTTVPDSELQLITIQRGRRSSLDTPEAGRATIILNNLSRRFDPSNPSSPEFGSGTRMAPDRRIRVRYQLFGADQIIFMGHIASWTTEHRNDAIVSPVRIEAIDPLGYLGSRTLSQTFTATDASSRIRQVLDAINWPGSGSNFLTGWRQMISPGAPALTTKTYTNATALSIMLESAAPTRGALWAAANGTITYEPSRSIFFQASPQASYGGASGLAYTSADFVVDRSDIITQARITGATEQVVTSSLTQMMPRVYSTSLPISDTQALNLATTLIQRYEVPRPATKRFVVANPTFEPAFRDLNVEIQITLAQPIGGAQARRYLIEGLEHTIAADPRSWTSVYYLTPREVYV